MKKILITSLVSFILSFILILSSCIISGFDFYEMTNYGNFEKKTQTMDWAAPMIIFNECENVYIMPSKTDEVIIEYYVNKYVDYSIVAGGSYISIMQIGQDSTVSFVDISDTKVNVYLPENKLFHIEVKSERRSTFVDVKKTENIDYMKINTKSLVLNINHVEINRLEVLAFDVHVAASIMDSIVHNIEIRDPSICILNLTKVIANNIRLYCKETITYFNKLDIATLEFHAEVAFVTGFLPYSIDDYFITVWGNVAKNFKETDSGKNRLYFKCDEGILNLNFN